MVKRRTVQKAGLGTRQQVLRTPHQEVVVDPVRRHERERCVVNLAVELRRLRGVSLCWLNVAPLAGEDEKRSRDVCPQAWTPRLLNTRTSWFAHIKANLMESRVDECKKPLLRPRASTGDVTALNPICRATPLPPAPHHQHATVCKPVEVPQVDRDSVLNRRRVENIPRRWQRRVKICGEA